MPQTVIAAFYQFAPLHDFANHRAPLTNIGEKDGLTGTILLAKEGINGTIAGSRKAIDAMLEALRALPGCTAMEHKESFANENPFYRLKVKLKREIVTMGEPDIDPNQQVGTYVKPEDWNALITDPDVVIIDTRNAYEVSIGTFENAQNPNTKSFRDFPKWFRDNRERMEGKKIAMFCTGGIRCEKATALVKKEGIDDVYHLEGGILKYLEQIPADQSLWHGECFVFDQRVSVKEGLAPGSYDMCHACRQPIDDTDKTSPRYHVGVSCPHCYDANSQEQKDRFAQRQHQIELARERGEPHMGKIYKKPKQDIT